MPGLEFWFCVPERDWAVSPFILSRSFSDFNKLLILLQLQKFGSRQLIQGSVFSQILLEVNTQGILFYSRSGLLGSFCFLQCCRRKVHFPKRIHSAEHTLRTGDFLKDQDCVVVASGLPCGGKVVTSFCHLCSGLPYLTSEDVNSYMQSVVFSSRCLPVCFTGVTFLLQTSHTNNWFPPK